MNLDFLIHAVQGLEDYGFKTGQHMTKEEFKRHCSDGIRRMEDREENIPLRMTEELGELNVAISKVERCDGVDYDDARLKLIEEMADVLWVIGCLMDIHDISERTMVDMVRLKEWATVNKGYYKRLSDKLGHSYQNHYDQI